MRIIPSLGLSFAMALAGAAHAGGAGPTLDGVWRVVTLAGEDLPEAPAVEIEFSAGRMSGTTGCNRFFASVEAGDALSLGPIGMTRMLCQGEAARIEALMLAQLATLDGWDIDAAGRLRLFSGAEMALGAERR